MGVFLGTVFYNHDGGCIGDQRQGGDDHLVTFFIDVTVFSCENTCENVLEQQLCVLRI